MDVVAAKARHHRRWALISSLVFLVMLGISSIFSEELSASELLVYVVLAILVVSTISAAYYVPRAIGATWRERRQRRSSV
jgi:hypothetical protein